jgi:predicted  nucleic acid-binding Zn-ribbon protein
MPHQCLQCGKVFKEGSNAILRGCPDCGGKKFFFTKNPLNDAERENLLKESRVDVEAITRIIENRTGQKMEEGDEWLHVHPDNIRDILADLEEKKREVVASLDQERDTVESIAVDDVGSYRINLKRLLDDESIIIHKDGSYLIHLPSLLTGGREK